MKKAIRGSRPSIGGPVEAIRSWMHNTFILKIMDILIQLTTAAKAREASLWYQRVQEIVQHGLHLTDVQHL